jgi:hypothetical protein
MAKLADYYMCDLRYTDEGYVIADEDEVRPNIYEDNDEYIKEFWGEYPFIGKFPVMYRGKLVDVLVFKDEGKCMKNYIVVKEYICEPDRKPEVVAQFDTRDKAEEYSLQQQRLREFRCIILRMAY